MRPRSGIPQRTTLSEIIIELELFDYPSARANISLLFKYALSSLSFCVLNAADILVYHDPATCLHVDLPS